MQECRTTQSTLTTGKMVSSEHFSKTFDSLILGGKVNAAHRLLGEQSAGGVLPLSDEVYQDLQKNTQARKRCMVRT